MRSSSVLGMIRSIAIFKLFGKIIIHNTHFNSHNTTKHTIHHTKVPNHWPIAYLKPRFSDLPVELQELIFAEKAQVLRIRSLDEIRTAWAFENSLWHMINYLQLAPQTVRTGARKPPLYVTQFGSCLCFHMPLCLLLVKKDLYVQYDADLKIKRRF